MGPRTVSSRGGKKFPSGVEYQFSGRSARRLVTVLTELLRTPYSKGRPIKLLLCLINEALCHEDVWASEDASITPPYGTRH
jgi:hypothetical protein